MQDKSRDYLANERTYLAYLRTALAFIAFGFIIARFSLFAREFSVVAHVKVTTTYASTEFGASMAAVGMVIALYGSYRYAAMNAAIDKNKSARMQPWAAIAGGVVVAAIGVLVAVTLLQVR